MSHATVLVVEDDAHLLSGIKDILELEDYRVLTATNGLSGLDVLKKDPVNPPDIIVSDIMMPHMDGFEFLEEVRKADDWVKIPFIFLTAKGERTDIHRGSLLGADVYLTKPFDAEDLLVAVAARLNRARNIERVEVEGRDNMKRKILTILNHEFRTPLTLVVAYADMLKSTDTSQMDESELMTFLRGVNSGADRLRRLIENFIMLVEIDTGDAVRTFSWRKGPVNIVELLQEAQRQIRHHFQERNISIDIEIEDVVPEIISDRDYLTVTLRELLDNAVKFSAEGSTVRVVIQTVQDGVAIHVIDTGRGVPVAEHDNIWKPFYQINRDLYEDQGSGSGLAIVDGIVEMHGGQRYLVSEEGEGSTFSVILPLEPSPIAETSRNGNA